ncbi:unnamed protein product [Psylliodes chrysocephalus]|uniref:Tetratricopeptide repeat protein 12 n=1 Tax=Psylliodes chrysocephalus TaxID=3402493 RepID=A0A9P0CDX1_9CUCU|nr:unnamed protein product [Psylliodes chrysocephala]
MSDRPRPSKYQLLNGLPNEEEFNNFMVKVTEVNKIVKKLASTDKKVSEIGDLEAKQYLGETCEKIIENIDGETELVVRNNRTVINKKAFEEISKDPNTMSQEAFMREVEKDADKRFREKLVRKEKMRTFKKQATLAFRREEYEKALTLYNKAIDQIKDCVVLYNNRALTCINLKLYDKAESDLDWALRINEDCVKSWLLLAKAHYLQNKITEYKNDIKEALQRNPDMEDFIQDYIKNLEQNEPRKLD